MDNMTKPKIDPNVILDGIEDAIIAQNRAGDLLYANHKAATLLGFAGVEQLLTYSADELTRQFVALDVSGQPVPTDLLPARQALAGNSLPTSTLRYRTLSNGEERWLRVKAITADSADAESPVAITFFRDVTAEKESEYAQRRSEELFAKAFRVSPAALWISNLDTGVALDVNASFLRITGYDREEVIGETVMSLGLWADPGTRSEVIQAVQERGSVHDLEFRFCKKSGELREGLLSAEIAEIENQSCLFISCVDITARKRAEAQVQAGREDLQALSRRLLEVQESERRHIARELHDEIGQVLTAVQINIGALERMPEAHGLSARLDESLNLVDHALQQIRNLSLDLRPSLLDDLGLVSALLWYIERQNARTDLDIQFGVDPAASLPGRLPSSIETASFRIVQEAITNIVRHAKAKEIKVMLGARKGNLQLTISDDGTGFDVRAARERASKGGSMGILGMQERAELVGGNISIKSEPGQGTTVAVLLPLHASPPRKRSGTHGSPDKEYQL